MQNDKVQRHYRRIRGILLTILFLNWSVALAKIIYGLITHTTSMAADGLHSLSDGASNIIGIIGIHLASRPQDHDHPYGHKKYETFFSLAIAMLLIMLAFGLMHKAWERLHSPISPRVGIISYIIMVSTMAVNFIVMRYEAHQGRKLKSDILIADSLHTQADIFTSLSVLLTLFFIQAGYPILDPIATAVIAAFIAYAGYSIIKNSFSILTDSAARIDPQKLHTIIYGITGVKTCHKIRTRGRPDDVHIDLHVQVDPSMHMDEAHRISYAIEQAIKEGMPEITDVVVHMEPAEDG